MALSSTTNKNQNKELNDNPLLKFIGCRVVRGPDWCWGKQDGKFKDIVLNVTMNFC